MCEHLFKSKNRGIDIAYEYIKNNKDKFDTLFDYTCDDLNNRFDIIDGFEKSL